jgi:hypothetical protein
MSKIKPICINVEKIRELRQLENINRIKLLLSNKYENIEQKDLEKICNKEQLRRTIQYLEIKFNDLIEKCEDDIFCKLLSMNISVCASRQGSTDEHFIFDECNKILDNFGSKIKKLGVNDKIPTNCGNILSKKEHDVLYTNRQYKSFDGELIGKKHGWIFAKICYGSGGHQDNVFIEAHEMVKWFIKYGQEDELYVFLIDTDKKDKIKDLKNKCKNHKNILVANHVEFQQYYIDNFSENKKTTKKGKSNNSD